MSKERLNFIIELRREIMEQFTPRKRSQYCYTMRCVFCGAADLFHINERTRQFKCYDCERGGDIDRFKEQAKL